MPKSAICFMHFCDHNEPSISQFIDANIVLQLSYSYESIGNLIFDETHHLAFKTYLDIYLTSIPIIHSSGAYNFYVNASRLLVQANSFSWVVAKVFDEMPSIIIIRNLSALLKRWLLSKLYLSS